MPMRLGDDPLLDPSGWYCETADNGIKRGPYIIDGKFVDNNCPLYVKKAVLAWVQGEPPIPDEIDNIEELREMIRRESAEL